MSVQTPAQLALARLAAKAVELAVAERGVEEAVIAARAECCTWGDIGAIFDTSRQTAWMRWHHLPGTDTIPPGWSAMARASARETRAARTRTTDQETRT